MTTDIDTSMTAHSIDLGALDSAVLTDEERETQGSALHQQVMRLKGGIEHSFFLLGITFRRIKDAELYRGLGFSTFEEYIAHPDVDMSRRTVYRMINAAVTYLPEPTEDDDASILEELEGAIQVLAPIGVGKLDVIAPLIRDASDEREQDDIFSKAMTTNIEALRAWVREQRRDGTEQATRTPSAREYLLEVRDDLRAMVMMVPTTRDLPVLLDQISDYCIETIARINRGELPGAGVAPDVPKPKTGATRGTRAAKGTKKAAVEGTVTATDAPKKRVGRKARIVPEGGAGDDA